MIITIIIIIYNHHESNKCLSFLCLVSWTLCYLTVCATSYHGPPSSSPGANLPLFSQKHNQVLYPAPPRPEQAQEAYLLQFAAWLAAPPQADLGCLLFEPQWGSTAAGRCWHPVTLRKVREGGILC